MGAGSLLTGLGAAFGYLGEAEEKRQKRRAMLANISYYKTEAEFINYATQREEDIFLNEAAEVSASQMGAFAKAGVDFSGSAMLKFAETNERKNAELLAIRENKRRQLGFASLRRREAERDLKSSGGFMAALGPMGTLLGGAAKTTAASGPASDQGMGIGSAKTSQEYTSWKAGK